MKFLYCTILSFTLPVFSFSQAAAKAETIICGAMETEAFVDSLRWETYLQKSLADLLKNCSQAESILKREFVVLFVVGRDGNIESVKIQGEATQELADAIQKIFLCAPRWTPAQRNGRPVRSFRKASIRFPVDNSFL